MTQAIPERRSMRRFDMRLPAAVRLSDDHAAEMTTETNNVSARGIFFHVPAGLRVGDQVAVTLTFPPQVTLTEKVRVRFEARVIRVEPQSFAGGPVGVAATIEAYEFLRGYPLEHLQERTEPDWSK
ncbi:MAG TPA: PilZ domain-containing protein [Terriglobales bacterium]|nr:PilZ domain-containing protein [Terriglobales bacterium]